MVVPSFDDSELNPHTEDLRAGEDVMLWPVNSARDGASLNKAISEITGNPTLSNRHAVVDANGLVTAVIKADPAIDSVDGCELIQSDDAKTGWVYGNGKFNAPEIIADVD